MRMTLKVVASAICILFISLASAFAQNASEYYSRALKSLESGHKEEAVGLIKKALDIDPSNVGYRRHLGWLLYDTANFEESREQFQKIVHDWPDDFEALSGLVYSSLKSKKGKAAVQPLQAYVKRHPENKKAILILAQLHTYSPETRSQGIDELQRILESDSTNRTARKGFADAYSWGGQYENAIENYEIILLDHPEDAEARLELARVYSWNRQYRESITQYQMMLESDPKNFVYRHELARVFAWSKHYRESLDHYQKLTREKPGDTELKLEYAETLSWAARFDQSIKQFEQILKVEPDNERAKLGLANAYHWKGAQYTAEDVYQQVMRNDTKNVDAMKGIAESQYWSNRIGKAKDSYEKLLAMDSQNSEAREGLEEIENRIAPSFSPHAGYYRDSTEFERQSYGLSGVYHISPDTPVELGFVRSRFDQHDESVYRSSTGIRASHLFDDRFFVTLGYIFHDYSGDNGTSNSYLASGSIVAGDYTTVTARVNRLDIVDTLTGEDSGIAAFQYLGNGGTNIEAVRKIVHTTDYSALITQRLTGKLSAAANFTFGDVSDPAGQEKEIRNLTLIYHAFYRENSQLNVLYNYYFLGFDKGTPLYFSPEHFENHSLIFQWRHEPTEHLSYGMDASPMFEPGKDLFGGSLATFTEYYLTNSLSFHAYVAYLDTALFSGDGGFRSRVFVISLVQRF